ncbi:MAG: hypothetical protein HOG33_04525 [Candidatus Marinimicrobia bacterium]|nr:hypothetical protein [Candidatus Neomarinimicrobiota bacterium]MBT3938324.1 hypothetical protein [Pelagibacterales bacterium]MBT5096645.1 hypothetical protein [Candidatus Neomarinimicrobiota bacterium]
MRKIIWLYLSSFGIMFAILSWMQESHILSNDLGALKGFIALLSGTILYFAIPKYLD